MDQANKTFAGTFPKVTNLYAGGHTERKMNDTAEKRFWESKNGFFDAKGYEDIHSTTTGTKKTRNFGFRNHSHALGSTVRHFQTLTDFPSIAAKPGRSSSTVVQKEAQKQTLKQVPDILEQLKNDPKALEIFMDELAYADQTQPKHLRFLSDLPQNAQGEMGVGYINPAKRRFDAKLAYNMKNANSIFNDMFGVNNKAFKPMMHDKTKRLGYNLGFSKATFATAFDKKEYFERVIRPDNKRHLVPGIQANRHQKN